MDDRSARLVEYWNQDYATQYQTLVEQAVKVLPEELAGTIATQLYRVMAYKDEYEVHAYLQGKVLNNRLKPSLVKVYV